MEKNGPEALESDVKQCLRKQCKKKERLRTAFYKDPYRFAKNLLISEKTGSLKILVRELEEHLKNNSGQNHW